MLEEKILNEEIKIFKVGNLYRIYGKTFDVKDELSSIGAKWNNENKKLEISLDDFNNLSETIKNKVYELEKKQRQMSLETISHIIMSGQIKVYLNQDEEYQIYGRTKDIFKDLQNLGFSLNDKNYTMRKEDFERVFPNEVKEESIYEEEYEKEYEQ